MTFISIFGVQMIGLLMRKFDTIVHIPIEMLKLSWMRYLSLKPVKNLLFLFFV